MLVSGATLLGLAQNNTVSSGSDITGSGGNVSYSVGQVFYTSADSNGISSTAGLQQAYVITSSKYDPIIPTLQVKVYPNPAVDRLTVEVNDENGEEYTCALYDMQGKVILQSRVTDKTSLLTQDLPASNYVLKISNAQTTVKSFHIIKN